jgi:hypothetical protein
VQCIGCELITDSNALIPDDCFKVTPVPQSRLKYQDMVYPMSWTWGDSSATILGTLGSDWPADAPVAGHYAFHVGGRYALEFQSDFDFYIDLETGTVYRLISKNPSEVYLPPDQGGNVPSYLKGFQGFYADSNEFLNSVDNQCIAKANVAYFSTTLLKLIRANEFTDAYLIPPERLHFGGRLHYSTLFYVANRCSGYYGCEMFSNQIGVVSAAPSHFGVSVGYDSDYPDLDLETGDIWTNGQRYPAPAGEDPTVYLMQLHEMQRIIQQVLLNVPVDQGKNWSYGNLPVVLETSYYFQHIVDTL